MRIARGTAGMNADPSCSRQVIRPASCGSAGGFDAVCGYMHDGHTLTTALAQNPMKIPKAVQSCHPMTRAPRIRAGAISAAYIVTVAAVKSATSWVAQRAGKAESWISQETGYTPLAPRPKPMISRTASRACHECVKPEAIGVAIRMIAVMKISPRRPNQLFKGSDTAIRLVEAVNSRQTPASAAEM